MANYNNVQPQYDQYGRPVQQSGNQYQPGLFNTQPYPNQFNNQYGFQARPAMTGISGRVVNRIEDIMPGEVAMDYSTAYFPLADGSGIIAKRWTPNGELQTIAYQLVQENSEANGVKNPLDEINERLTNIEKMMRKPRNNKPKQRKENSNGNSEHA